MSRLISLDNGLSYQTATEAMPDIIRQDLWNIVINHMDDSTREAVHHELAPCTELEFLQRYLEIASHNLTIG